MKWNAAIRKPYLMRVWENYPKTWKFMIDIGILVKYKTLNIKKLPKTLTLPSSTILYIDSEENRGRALLISNGVTQKRLDRFWSMAVKIMNPDLVIDVGVNYGECIFSTQYPPGTRIIGVEANSRLIPFIEQSKEAHPNRSQIAIYNAIASDKDNEETVFFVDRHWSGTSSATYEPSHKLIDKVPVQSITIDTLCHDQTYETVLFKVDVEGYEAFVLKGMTNLFKTSKSILGFIEFNSEYLEKLGISVDEFLLILQTYFTIFVYKEDHSLVKAAHYNYMDLKNLFGTDYIHTDFLLVSDESFIERLHISYV